MPELDKNLTAGASDEENKEEVEETTETVEEESPYKAELERIEAEKQAEKERADAAAAELEQERNDRKRQMEIKDKALEKEKAKTADIGEKFKSELMQEWERKQDLRDARAKISEITTDATAQKVTLHYFETLPESLRTGSVEDQLITAFALASRKNLPNLIAEQNAEDAAERRSLSSMGGDGGGRSSFKNSPSVSAQAASKLRRAYAGKDKELAKRLAEKSRLQ